MFKNIGAKIKTIAKFYFWIGIISWVIIGLIVFASLALAGANEFLPSIGAIVGAIFGVLVAAFGVAFTWVSSLPLYGLGQAIENTDTLIRMQRNQGRSDVSVSYGDPQEHPYDANETMRYRHPY